LAEAVGQASAETIAADLVDREPVQHG
jgi:hypothetical protein